MRVRRARVVAHGQDYRLRLGIAPVTARRIGVGIARQGILSLALTLFLLLLVVSLRRAILVAFLIRLLLAIYIGRPPEIIVRLFGREYRASIARSKLGRRQVLLRSFIGSVDPIENAPDDRECQGLRVKAGRE